MSRFYSNNIDVLPSPFKAIQIGSVFRADRPQKGRFRQFTQCDIDILGEDSCLAEIDLICATSNAISNILEDEFEVHINDRKIISSIIEIAEISDKDASVLMIELDKIDKIGLDGFAKSLIEKGIDIQKIEHFCDIFTKCLKCSHIDDLKDILKDHIDSNVIDDLSFIIDTVRECNIKGLNIVFDPTIVRGMNYYTGPIFEIKTLNSNLSIAGGGRYDNMISNFTSSLVPACGFSIGFERMVELLLERKVNDKTDENKESILIDKKLKRAKIKDIIKESYIYRDNKRAINILEELFDLDNFILKGQKAKERS